MDGWIDGKINKQKVKIIKLDDLSVGFFIALKIYHLFNDSFVKINWDLVEMTNFKDSETNFSVSFYS